MPDNLCSCSFITEKGTKTNREQEALQLVTRAHPLPATQQRVPGGQQWEQPMDNAASVALLRFTPCVALSLPTPTPQSLISKRAAIQLIGLLAEG